MCQPITGRALHCGVALAALVWGSLVGTVPAEDTPTVTAPAASMRVHIDPKTGAIVPAPVVRPAPAQMPPAANHSVAGLVERPAPGGGVMIDVQGRFMSPMTAQVAPDGAPHAECHGPQAEASATR